MSEKTNKITRREALGTLGTVLAATAVVGLVVETANAQVAQVFDLSVEKYVIYLNSAPQYNWESRIYLYDATLSKSCIVYFMKDGQAIPANTVAANLMSAAVYFPKNRYTEIIDFLRREKPITMKVVGSNGIATLANGEYELVGDLDI
jgi:hypothetical protein